MTEVENIIPVFPVGELKQSIEFYTNELGFQLDWQTDHYCSISRSGHSLMLSDRVEQGTPAMAWIGLETEALITECVDRQRNMVEQPRNDTFAYHCKICDPDGNILWLGTESRSE